MENQKKNPFSEKELELANSIDNNIAIKLGKKELYISQLEEQLRSSQKENEELKKRLQEAEKLIVEKNKK